MNIMVSLVSERFPRTSEVIAAKVEIWFLVEKLRSSKSSFGQLTIEWLTTDRMVDVLDHRFESLWGCLFHDHLSFLLHRAVEHIFEDRAHTSKGEFLCSYFLLVVFSILCLNEKEDIGRNI